MNKIRLGIIGSSGFIGSHLFQRARIDSRFLPVAGGRELFDADRKMSAFLRSCDAVIDLAGVSRAADQEELYRVNMELARKIAEGMKKCEKPPRLYFGSTTHIQKDLPYHRSKRDSMVLLAAAASGTVEMLMPNTFGPLAPPFYNSVVSTFCVLAAQNRAPEQIDDALLELIPVEQLTRELLNVIAADTPEVRITLSAPYQLHLPELWALLLHFKQSADAGAMPALKSPFEGDLWYTFQSYLSVTEKPESV